MSTDSLLGMWCLPQDVELIDAAKLRPAVRTALDPAPGDHVLTRPAGRTRALLLDVESAAFVRLLHHPTSIAKAVLTFARFRGEDPDDALDGLYPLLTRMRSMGLLTRPAKAERLAFTVSTGDWLGGWLVADQVQTLEDTEVYRARSADGTVAAVKVGRRGAPQRVALDFTHEFAVLRRLEHVAAVPDALDLQTGGERPLLAVGWRAGVDALTAARSVRGDPSRLLRLCTRITESYADVHEAGVVHADVHPKNVIVAPDGSVTILDFALAAEPNAGRWPARQGVGYFFEPEYARAALNGRPLPQPTTAGEVHAVAAMLSLLVTGEHYLKFPLERCAFLRAIATDPPVSWRTRAAGRQWPELEETLGRALAKEPSARPTMRELADALAAVRHEHDRAARSLALVRDAARRAPTGPVLGSVHLGAAGTAYALLRAAQLTREPELLARAEAWVQHEATPSPSEDSLHHGGFGLAVVRTLVAHGTWDVVGARAAVHDLLARADRPSAGFDVTHGRAGVLLGLAEVAETLPDDPLFERPPVLTAGGRLARAAWDDAESADPALLGMAHGWAGILYAQLRWADAAEALPPEAVGDRLDQLRDAAVRAARGLRWPLTTGTDVADVAFPAGWCNGAAGFALLFALADALLPGSGYDETAVAAGTSAWTLEGGGATVCCGAAGRAYAMLRLWHLTGEQVWLERAQQLARRLTPPPDRPTTPGCSLYKGALGVRLLALDVEAAEENGGGFPLLEPLGWAHRSWRAR